jgi:hypothetical protein
MFYPHPVESGIVSAFLVPEATMALAGDLDRALAHYPAAASRTTSLPEREYLIIQAARVRRRRSG